MAETSSLITPLDFVIPPELRNLSVAERMFIQNLSPILRLSFTTSLCETETKGSCGSKGHVWMCTQDTPKAEEGSTTTLRVRKEKVRLALEWLRDHNAFYRDVKIDMSISELVLVEEGALLEGTNTIARNENNSNYKDNAGKKEHGSKKESLPHPFNK
jgi:hypothetical protein